MPYGSYFLKTLVEESICRFPLRVFYLSVSVDAILMKMIMHGFDFCGNNLLILSVR